MNRSKSYNLLREVIEKDIRTRRYGIACDGFPGPDDRTAAGEYKRIKNENKGLIIWSGQISISD